MKLPNPLRWLILQQRREDRRRRNIDRLVRRLNAMPAQTFTRPDGSVVELKRVAFMLSDGTFVALEESK